MSVAKTYPRTFIPELLLLKKVVYKPESLIFLLSINETYNGAQMAFTGSKLTIRALEQGVKYVQELKQTISLQIFLRHPPGVFIVNFEHISYLVLLFLLLTLNLQLPAGRN